MSFFNLVFLFSIFGVSQSEAALTNTQIKKKTTTTKTSEVYTALENPEDVSMNDMSLISSEIVVEETKPIKKQPLNSLEDRVSALEKKLLTKEEVTPSVEKPAEKPVKQTSVFFEVPTERKATIAKRLKLVESILLKSGRAYDYRSLTTKQLEEILAALQPQKVAPLSE